MINQLRVYEISPDLKDAFDERFEKHASRIMKSYGFNIVAMWYSKTETKLEFVYILQWPDEATMQKQWEAFMSDTEWGTIKKESRDVHGEMVLAKVSDQVLKPTTWFKQATQF